MMQALRKKDVMKLQLKLDEEERIIDVKFKTYGCGSAMGHRVRCL